MAEIVVKRWREMSGDEFFDIARLRSEVFFVEQRIDEPDFDDADRAESSLHYWISDEQGCAAYLRAVVLEQPQLGATRSFGRVAVRADRRGERLARALVERVIADFGHEPMVIHSQSYVCDLYADYGFSKIGHEYYEASLPHFLMVRSAG